MSIQTMAELFARADKLPGDALFRDRQVQRTWCHLCGWASMPSVERATSVLATKCREHALDPVTCIPLFSDEVKRSIQARFGLPRFDTDARTRFLACLGALLERERRSR